MKKTGNFFADTAIETSLLLFVYLLLNVLWTSYGFLLISPLIVIAASLMGLQSFLWIDFFLTCSFVALLLFLTPWFLKFTRNSLQLMGQTIFELHKNYRLRHCEC
ncbi:hypothetical protein [Enterococcus phoeniculicola]|uniref:Uncharacterized protein n=1 Tax=Enterococcus phoeniculicola ATCC BAA-412 TaxID=1158610 RepID=R3W4F9_9ENTE|nr:hypothetical protein [Enterococcus phoeniculicola]EOL42482.1 hypothetical protein UC3_02834 [Enterococcus phoeniculicola ATCC BAA-412]EOT79239.1 hypothetical protein I589_00747 [Enterococcus phoeniculicola ATCC BAA-412]